MALRPGQNSPYDFCLTDRRSKQEWYFKLNGGGRGIERTSFSDDTGGIYIRAVGKKTGDFDEQRDWKGGRGNNYFNDDPTAYADGKDVWSLMKNAIFPGLQWHWVGGYRNADMVMPGSVIWKALIPGSNNHRYLAVKFVASASYSADKAWALLRCIGFPGTLTLELCSDSAGNPGTALKSATLAATSVEKLISFYNIFDWATTEALTSATTYWVKLYGAATDTDAHHWEVGCDDASSNGKKSSDGSSWSVADFAPFFRVTDADTDRQWFFYGDENAFFAVDKKASGNSQHYTISEADTPAMTENTSSGLATVSGRPVIASGFHFFPQGDGSGGTAIRRWNGTQWRSEATGNKAKFLEKGYAAEEPVVWKVLSQTTQQAGAAGTVGVKRAPSTQSDGTPLTWAADASNMLVFGSLLRIGSATNGITGIYHWGSNGLFVWKSSSMWVIQNDKVREWDFSGRGMPALTNGVAAIATSQFLYFNWIHTTKRIFGQSINDILHEMNYVGNPDGREGVFSAYCEYGGWVFGAIDAGASGTSCVWVWDERGWHEIFRAPAVGMRIRDVRIQPRVGKAARVWIDCGGDVFYFTMPKFKYEPLNDPACEYMHEGVIESSVLDMGAASKLPKFIRDLTATIANLNGQGIRVELDYRIDDAINTSGGWIQAGTFLQSPEDTVRTYVSDLTQFQYRLRMMTTNNLIPPVLRGIVPSGFARSPFRLVWSVRVVVGESTAPGGQRVNRDELDQWLAEAAIVPGRVYMTSKWPVLHDYYVIVGSPTTNPISIPSTGVGEKDIHTVTLVEV